MKHFLLLSLTLLTAFNVFAVEENADSANLYLAKAKQLSLASKIWEADKNFQKAIFFNPDNAEIRVEYGNHLVAQRKYFIAVEQFGKVLETDAEHKIALQKLADLSFLLRRWKDVIKYSNHLLQHKTGINVQYMLGNAYYELEDYGQSRNYLNAAIAENSNKSEAVVLLGKVLIELSDYRQAVAVYQKSLLLNPDDKKLLYELGMLYFTIENDREAARYFELAADKGLKKDLGFYENLGLAYLGFDIAKGVEVLNKVLESKPDNVEILFQVAQAYFKNEKFQDAAEVYQQIFAVDPANSRALFMTGVAYQKKGDKHKGVSFCEQAIKMDPALAQHRMAKFVL